MITSNASLTTSTQNSELSAVNFYSQNAHRIEKDRAGNIIVPSKHLYLNIVFTSINPLTQEEEEITLPFGLDIGGMQTKSGYSELAIKQNTALNRLREIAIKELEPGASIPLSMAKIKVTRANINSEDTINLSGLNIKLG